MTVGDARGRTRRRVGQGAEWLDAHRHSVHYDHPFHAPLDHALGIDFINEAEGGRDRVAVELSAASAQAAKRSMAKPRMTWPQPQPNDGLARQLALRKEPPMAVMTATTRVYGPPHTPRTPAHAAPAHAPQCCGSTALEFTATYSDRPD